MHTHSTYHAFYWSLVFSLNVIWMVLVWMNYFHFSPSNKSLSPLEDSLSVEMAKFERKIECGPSWCVTCRCSQPLVFEMRFTLTNAWKQNKAVKKRTVYLNPSDPFIINLMTWELFFVLFPIFLFSRKHNLKLSNESHSFYSFRSYQFHTFVKTWRVSLNFIYPPPIHFQVVFSVT